MRKPQAVPPAQWAGVCCAGVSLCPSRPVCSCYLGSPVRPSVPVTSPGPHSGRWRLPGALGGSRTAGRVSEQLVLDTRGVSALPGPSGGRRSASPFPRRLTSQSPDGDGRVHPPIPWCGPWSAPSSYWRQQETSLPRGAASPHAGAVVSCSRARREGGTAET